MQKKKWLFCVLLTFLVFLGTILIVCKKNEKHSDILETIGSFQGYTRVVSAEEYEFYQYFVERELSGKVSAEELDRLVKEYASKVNAVFYLGNQLGFCEPYAFEVLKFRMEQENITRQIQLEEGEAIYGLEQFTMETYFQYTLDNLQADLQGYLEENADRKILKMAKNYYETHEEDFVYRKEVVYEQTLNDVTETVTADVDLLSFYGKADIGLADFLGTAQVGDTYEDDQDGKERKIVLKEITYSEKGFENNEKMAVYLLIREELYDKVIENTALNNPLEFETN